MRLPASVAAGFVWYFLFKGSFHDNLLAKTCIAFKFFYSNKGQLTSINCFGVFASIQKQLFVFYGKLVSMLHQKWALFH